MKGGTRQLSGPQAVLHPLACGTEPRFGITRTLGLPRWPALYAGILRFGHSPPVAPKAIAQLPLPLGMFPWCVSLTWAQLDWPSGAASLKNPRAFA